jgi:hypothetical protein
MVISLGKRRMNQANILAGAATPAQELAQGD